MATTPKRTKPLARIGIDARVHAALARHLDRQRAEVGRAGVPTLAGFTEQALISRLKREAPDLVARLSDFT